MKSENTKKNIGFLSPGWPLSSYPNGIVSYVDNLTSSMSEHVRCEILTARLDKESELTGEQVVFDLNEYQSRHYNLTKIINRIYNLLPKAFSDRKAYESNVRSYAEKIIYALKQHEIELLEIEESFGLGRFIKSESDIPIITRLHGPWFIHGPIMNKSHEHTYLARISAEGEAIVRSDGITSPSDDVLMKVREYYGVELPNAKVIPNPVKPVIEELRWSLSSQNKPYILVVSRFDLHKGGDIAIDAFRAIASQNKDISLVFVGPDRGVEVQNERLDFHQYVEKFIPEIHIRERINFLGQQDTKTIAELRKSCTLTMVTSRYDNFPLSVLEALASGSPVVSVNTGGIKEIIKHGYNGILATSISSDDIANSVLTLLDDDNLKQSLSSNGIHDCMTRFSPGHVANLTFEYYKKFL